MSDKLARIALVILALSFLGNSCVTNAGLTEIRVKNEGRDPIHIGGKRVNMNSSATIDMQGNGKIVEYEMKRNDINLGRLRVTSLRYEKDESFTVTITMTEPQYFDFVFTSSNPEVATASWQRP